VNTLAGKRVLVTGGSRGIGRATALAFAQAGAAIGFNYSRSEDDSEAAGTLAALRATGVPTFSSCADVGDPAAVTQLFAEARTVFGGPIDVLVNNAAVTQDAPLMMMKDESWDRVLDVDLRGVFLCCRAALRGMIGARWGRIVNVVSPAAFVGQEGAANYAAAKAGVLGLTKSLAREVARFGITVNAVSPGLIETRLVDEMQRERRKDIERQIPLGRLGTPDEIAAAILFVASPAASYMTGSTVHVDGGLAMR
jgi:3-oxoacyl-[acyl-carrier protein] reductase